MTKTKKIVLGSSALLVGVAAFGSITLGSVFAQSNATAQEKRDQYVGRLAEVAGVDKTKLTDAMKTVSKENVAQDVKDGKITQTEADKINAKIDSGDFGPGMGMRGDHMGKGPGPFGGKETMDAVAKYLGVDEATLKSSEQSGKTLLQIAVEKGKTEADLKQFIKTTMETNLATAVKDGKITQEQADKMKANEDDMISHMINNTKPEGKMGGRGMGR
jgi:hypothetical protein